MQKYIFITFVLLLLLIVNHLFSTQKTQTIHQETTSPEKPPENEITHHPHSLPALMEKDFQGDDFTLKKVLAENDTYTRYFITYTSEGFTISGIMNIPKGNGPFPVLILNHGYIDPEIYTNGQGLKREQDFFARNGYVVIHSDYRDHAQSDTDPMNAIKPRTGYTEDVINVIVALKNSKKLLSPSGRESEGEMRPPSPSGRGTEGEGENPLSPVDTSRIGMLGHSMGGGIALNVMVTKPKLVQAYILLAPINSEYKINFDRWVATEMDDIAKRTLEHYGTFEENPEFWKTVSASNYLDRIQSPIQLHQGTADKDIPVKWSQELTKNFQQLGKNITYFEYENAPHVFINEQPLVMQRSLEFFDNHLKRE